MLEQLGLEQHERVHSGIDDCLHLAQVVANLSMRPEADLSPTHRAGRRLRGMAPSQRGDWQCAACGGICFKSKHRCYQCGAPRDGELPPVEVLPPADVSEQPVAPVSSAGGPSRRTGDWDCTACGALVFASRWACFKCNAPKPGTDAPPGWNPETVSSSTQDTRRAGDWDCSSCGAMVFASKSHCYQCNAPKPGGQAAWGGQEWAGQDYAPAQQQPSQNRRAGDWDCPQCGALVFASRWECFKCNSPRPDGGSSAGGGDWQQSEQQQQQSRRPGDWDCRSCGAMVFGSKNSCFKCGSSK